MAKVVICGLDTSTLPKLTNQEITDLMKKLKSGDEQARQEFIIGNMRLVLCVVQRFMGRKENIDDIFQVGCVGLIKAIDNFDMSLNVRFSTYAVPMIIGEIRRFLRDNNSVRVSRSLRDTAYKALQAREELELKCSNEPTMEEIAAAIDMPLREVVYALDAISDPVSLFDPVYHDGGDTITLVDQLSDEKNSDENWTESVALKEAIRKLAERERQILYLRYFEGKTQIEVSQEIGISQAQVSRLEKNALRTISKTM
ncbi:MAG TPA: RNA polymerase sporulation sigma factor SigG [Clostridiales bacterium]|jgi:RNA polymerase sporulation-specific sigma factor|nr:RNA polymerase sporulation sigma factor SigG [Clostridiales bacterium]